MENNCVNRPLETLIVLPGTRAMVYDPWANGREGYYKNEGAFMPATVVRRYGFISEYMEREYGRETAKYPDCVDVVFDHDGRISHGHFTDCIKVI
jgi:hypothetical protein